MTKVFEFSFCVNGDQTKLSFAKNRSSLHGDGVVTVTRSISQLSYVSPKFRPVPSKLISRPVISRNSVGCGKVMLAVLLELPRQFSPLFSAIGGYERFPVNRTTTLACAPPRKSSPPIPNSIDSASTLREPTASGIVMGIVSLRLSPVIRTHGRPSTNPTRVPGKHLSPVVMLSRITEKLS